MNTQYKWLLIALIFGLIACESDDDSSGTEEEVIITSGSADFSTYVSLGNSLTAGFTDGALFIAGQQASMPNILAQQFALAGGGEFTQPLMNDNIGGGLLGGTQILDPRLFFNGAGPATLDAEPTTEITNILSGPFNNMGIPGSKSFHLLASGYGNVGGLATMPATANPYFVRIASDPNATILEDAMDQAPTFFSLWIGNNDVLGYALTGGDGTDPITDEALFTQSYNALISTLTSGGADGVAFNIPDVTSIPHFTTVPYNPVPLDAATAAAVNQGYAAYNAGLLQVEGLGFITEEERIARTIEFVEGQNAVVIEDESLTDLSGSGLPPYRQATAEDLLVLPASNFIGTLANPADPLSVNGVAIPLEDKWVLLPSEQEEIAMATAAFNAIIESAVNQAGLAFVDANALLDQVAAGGVMFDEFLIQDDLVFGGAFSLDGVHPTARGYALLANTAMEAINTTYGSNLPMVEAGNYPLFYAETFR